MKRVKKQKTRLQQYQQYVNKKIAAVCAMTLSMSVLLSPFATSANNSSYPILISSVSEELTQSDNYVNVALSYHDIEETQLSVMMDVNVSLDSIVTDDEQVDIIEQSEDNKQENLEEEQLPKSEEKPTEVEENSIDDSTEESVEEIEESTENNISESSEVPSGETGTTEPSTEEIGDEESVTINENTESRNDLIEEQENSQEEKIESELTESVAFGQLNSVFNPIGQWIMKVLKPFIVNSRVIVEASELQEKSVMIDFPIHSSFSLDESTLKILGENDEELQSSSLKIEENRLMLEFSNDVPEQFSVFFILNRSESIESGDVIVNDGAVIQYRVEGSSGISEIKIPTMNANLYLLTQFMGLSSHKPSIYQSNVISAESSSDTSTTQITVPVGNNELYLDKTAEPQDDGSYLIKLKTSGKVQTITTLNKADIVLVMDKSGSMSDKIADIKDSVQQFTKDVLSINTTENPDMVRVAIVTYAQSANNLLGGFVSQYTTCKIEGSCSNRNENTNSVEYKIEAITANGGTNTEAGIKKAGELLTNAAQESGRSDAKQYVVFFTDGLPTYNDRYSGSDGSTYYGRNFRAAQESYYDYFKGPLLQEGSNTISVGGIGKVESQWVWTGLFQGEWRDNPDDLPPVPNYTPTQTPLNAKFYSIGLFTDSNKDEDAMAIAFLKTIQNVINEKDYAENYYTNDIETAQNIYTNIENEIVSEIKGDLLTNVIITDIVPSYLDILGDITVVGATPTETGNQFDEQTGKKTLTWKFANLAEGGVEISFSVKPNDPYLGGTNIPTNDSATIKATEINKSEGELYPVPKVDITPVQGGIKIDKQVVKNDGTPFTASEKFSINVTSMKDNQIQEQLGFDVAGNNVDQTVSFYLKGETTNISFNNDTTKNYLTAGIYTVEEIVPANYQQSDINIQYCDQSYSACHLVESYDTFMLDKDHRYILITITNKLVNESYWYNQVHAPNRFTYTK